MPSSIKIFLGLGTVFMNSINSFTLVFTRALFLTLPVLVDVDILMKACDQNIKRTLEITEEMIKLAKQGDRSREDNGCGILYGILLDSAYKIRKVAEIEKLAHIKKGWWNKEE